MEATQIRSVLDASGIPCVVIGSSQIPSLPFEVRVPNPVWKTPARCWKKLNPARPPQRRRVVGRTPWSAAGPLAGLFT